MLKSSNKGIDKEEVVFVKNKVGIWSGVLKTDKKEEIILDTISTVIFLLNYFGCDS